MAHMNYKTCTSIFNSFTAAQQRRQQQQQTAAVVPALSSAENTRKSEKIRVKKLEIGKVTVKSSLNSVFLLL